jgi:acyl-CoA synthetase (AMP-forming)/AMP-acid ligase II
MDDSINTVYGLLRGSARQWGDRPAIVAGGRRAMTYGELAEHVEAVRGEMAGRGLGAGSRVAIVLSNGPEAGVAFLAAAASGVAAPLNPAYRESELEFYLSDLRADAVIVEDGAQGAAGEVARRLGIRVLRIRIDGGAPAGTLRFVDGEGDGKAVAGDWPGAEGTALLLHTSGTTSRPKLVALTQGNLVRSAENIRGWLGLLPADRCLNIMPLFHIHGLIGAMLSSLAGGGSVVCSAGFAAPQFLQDVRDFEATWYSAVPTMHQAILARGEAEFPGGMKTKLRMIRSSSSALAPQVAKGLEGFFGVPVIEAYGMTEASHQMCCNPLPPGERKFGSVGLAAGPEVAVMDESGRLLGRGETGEIVIRGPSVTRGYENNAEANRTAFCNGWFRTGDLGRMDEAGYVFLAGRIKEIINRGGEKIAPREIDEVLLEHPAVAQAVAFGVPDKRLGEEIAAAVVLRGGARVEELELMQFAASKLADFKVPRRIEFLEKIPLGPTGKIQRVSLAKQLGIESVGAEPAVGAVADRELSADEKALAAIWCEVLKVDAVKAGDDFQELGGDSLRAAQVISRVKSRMGRRLRIMAFFRSPTLASVAAAIEPAVSSARR